MNRFVQAQTIDDHIEIPERHLYFTAPRAFLGNYIPYYTEARGKLLSCSVEYRSMAQIVGKSYRKGMTLVEAIERFLV